MPEFLLLFQIDDFYGRAVKIEKKLVGDFSVLHVRLLAVKP